MKKILLVDDEHLMLTLLELFLKPYGYHCVSVTSGQEAVRMLKKEDFDLLLLDVMMPDKNGWETTKEIRSFSKVPILILTARDQTADFISSINYGANGHISKSFNEHTLLKYVQSLTSDSVEIPVEITKQQDETFSC